MNLSIGKVYTFNTQSPVFLGAVIERAKLSSIVDATTARKFAPIDQIFAQVYPSLPPGSPNDVNAAIYYVFEGLNKSVVVLAENWIVENSIQLIEHVSIRVDIPRMSLSDVEVVRRALSAANLKDFVITTV